LDGAIRCEFGKADQLAIGLLHGPSFGGYNLQRRDPNLETRMLAKISTGARAQNVSFQEFVAMKIQKKKVP
jgi:hypothetical protein